MTTIKLCDADAQTFVQELVWQEIPFSVAFEPVEYKGNDMVIIKGDDHKFLQSVIDKGYTNYVQ